MVEFNKNYVDDLEEKIRVYVDNNNLSIGEVTAIKYADAVIITERRDFSGIHLESVKALIIAEIQNEEDEDDKSFIAEELMGNAREATMRRFPNLSVGKGRIRDVRFIILWLDAKSVEEEIKLEGNIIKII